MPDDLDPITHDYGQGKTQAEEAIDSAMMLATALIISLAVLVGLAAGVGLTLWLT